ncbi:hypothetical protein HPB52_021060 [Rhipicephalus sanguineus]|uniref:Uncharacterized protein n=1 Tax=Rhipicephalus sanguineus TaxID=34632 RepID=A0A9D4PFN0_RHISA|nr:hypothetical protein HPB52_021060 [Rhipicephalus sanguineus]
MTMTKLLVKDRNNTFNGKLVTFVADVPEEVLCACCSNISSQLMADPRDHLYCQSCLAMLEDDGTIDCVKDGAAHRIEEKVESGYKKIESDMRERLQELEERHAIYEEPIGKLLAEMAMMK